MKNKRGKKAQRKCIGKEEKQSASKGNQEKKRSGMAPSKVIPGYDGNRFTGDLHVGTDDTDLFFKEVLESLQRGIEENIKPENLILEINSSKHAYNVTITDVIELTVRALLTICVGGKVRDNVAT